MHDISIPDHNDFSGIDVESIQCINKMCDVIMSMHLDNVYITSKASIHSPFALGFGTGKIFRLDKGSILFSTAALSSADFLDLQMSDQGDSSKQDIMSTMKSSGVLEEEAYIYQTPGVALAWFLCKLGYGTNEANLEADMMAFKPHSPVGSNEDLIVRLCFEEERTPEQKMMYKAFASSVEQMSASQTHDLKSQMDTGENPFEIPDSDASNKARSELEKLFGGGRSSNPFEDPAPSRSAFFGKSLLDKIKSSH